MLVPDVLPGGRGTELFARMRLRHPALRVVFMSGDVDDEILANRRRRGDALHP